ncbi:uncharacterized protein LOC121382058 [Gigantopelta aegis]|uniref:uncharacterized protein LOC121382058 n=1 Tax=Gigantopelta aegis TaxID=1735272 RepID=UPI001B88872C|nr:uncharacterized protein LOC121382058 [Gigantopelta aegis]
MAAEPRRADVQRRRPSSAPKTSDMTNIPKIILDDRDRGVPDVYEGVNRPPGGEMGIPASSMPNLALERFMGPEGEGPDGPGHKLGVYCSPRMSRRSVDLEISSKDPNNEWMETFDPANTLRVLTTSSRVGSSVSLNSECTARSIGLISNDSSSDSASLSGRNNDVTSNDKQSHLRRLMSNPEDDTADVDTIPTRTSQSCVNLKAVNAPESDSSFCDKIETDLSLSTDLVKQENSANKRQVLKSPEEIIDESFCSHTVAYHYSKDKKSFQAGRIRQWLDDMDKNVDNCPQIKD